MQNGRLKELKWTKLDNAWSHNNTHNLIRSLSMAVNRPSRNLAHCMRRHQCKGQDNWLGSAVLSLLTFYCQNQSSSKIQSGALKRGLEPAILPEQPPHPTPLLYLQLCTAPPSPPRARMLLKISDASLGPFQMAVRAFGNHQTSPPISPAKTGAVMSPLHEGSVNSMSRSTGWHPNCTCPARTLK